MEKYYVKKKKSKCIAILKYLVNRLYSKQINIVIKYIILYIMYIKLLNEFCIHNICI